MQQSHTVRTLIDINQAYEISVKDINIVFARSDVRPCKRAPPRRYEIDEHALDPQDYVIWTSLYGDTINLNRMGV